MNDKTKILTLKETLREQYEHYRKLRPDFDSGESWLKYLKDEYVEARRALNETLDQLAILDPDTPTMRF